MNLITVYCILIILFSTISIVANIYTLMQFRKAERKYGLWQIEYKLAQDKYEARLDERSNHGD